MKKHNFSAGPCLLPQEVYTESSQAILDYNQTGLSILEISHRSQEFIDIYTHAQALVKELMSLDDNYEILFLHGGATLQFLMTTLNLMPQQDGKATYLDTGAWSAKAIKEAKKFGEIQVIKNENYKAVPKDYIIDKDASYFHCTSNNTIYGTQLKTFPDTEIPMVCDMSSDILSREIDYNQFGIIYAGAQKNIGPAGSTLVIVKKDLLGKTNRDIPSYLDYQQHVNKKGIFNTSPVFAIYVAMLNLIWLKNKGGIAGVSKLNQEKAALIYQEIDRNPLFEGYAEKEDRSIMNATFYLTHQKNKEKFDQLWQEAGIANLNGHRTVGGYRASMYNAMDIASVQVLVECMQELEQKA